jgi:transcriptional regulator with XRE-family HTH domain
MTKERSYNMRKDGKKITLAVARHRMGYDMEHAAEFVGVSLATIARWEQDSSRVPADKLQKLAKLYQVEFVTDFYLGKRKEFLEKIRKTHS